MHARTAARICPLRAKVFFYLVFLVASYLLWRLYHIQVVDGPALAAQARAQRADTIEIFARRGTIFDREGNVLVHSMPSESIYADPRQIAEPARVGAQLQSLLGRDDPALLSCLHERTHFCWIARKVGHDVAQRVRSRNLPGVGVLEEQTGRRYDSVGALASTVLGFVGIDENGLDGIEYSYDSLLRGTSGRMTLEADQFGHAIPFGRVTMLKSPRSGTSVMLSLDPYLQYVTERTLAQQVHTFAARSGTAIVMDPNSGEVLALANKPDYQPNAFAHFSASARRNRAVMDAYEPGSTFKLITAAASLESGRVRDGDRFAARDAITVGGHTIHNAEDGFMAGTGASESLEDIIAYSHNVGAAEVGMATGSRALYATMRKLGFGDSTQLGLPGENTGLVPAPDQWSDSSLATMSFGHGISVTPMQLIRAYAAIANGGLLLRPRIVNALLDEDGNTIYRYPREIERRVLSRKTSAILRKYLRTVVLRGTGKPTAQVAGYTTAGKTGTAQVVENGRYASGAYIASFVGFIPAERPRFLILVKIEQPQGAIYGSVVAAPAFAKIARAAMLHAGLLPDQKPASRQQR